VLFTQEEKLWKLELSFVVLERSHGCMLGTEKIVTPPFLIPRFYF
jgi:hypothetical protein